MDMAIPVFENQGIQWKPIIVAGIVGTITYLLYKAYHYDFGCWKQLSPQPPAIKEMVLNTDSLGVEMFSGPMPFKVEGGIQINEVVSHVSNGFVNKVKQLVHPVQTPIRNYLKSRFKNILK